MPCPRPFVTWLFVAAALATDALASDRYVAWLADGTRLSAKTLTAWPLPGAGFRFENHDLTGNSNPVRLVRDRQATLTLRPPYLVLANGDVLCGRAIKLEADDGRANQSPRIAVQLEAPLTPVTGTMLSVRANRIQRIVAAPGAGEKQPPGTIVLTDGRRLVARSIRWREYSLAILTADGVVDLPFGDLAEVVFPSVDSSAAVIEDNLWATTKGPTAIARFHTADGSIITTSRASREHEQARRRGRLTNAVFYYLQPAWADQAVAVPEQDIACCGYRGDHDAPLTLFAFTTIANRRLVGQAEPWIANRAASGDLLATGSRESDTGLAAHASSDIAFDLPADAKTLSLVAGLSRDVGDGGCVQCKVIGDVDGKMHSLWDSGVIQGKDGDKPVGPLDVSKVSRVHLIVDDAHEDRPPGADPLDIRDEVAWLTPLVTLDSAAMAPGARAHAVLAGAADWQLVNDGWQEIEVSSRWNVPAGSWDTVLALKKGTTLSLKRTLQVTAATDIVELLTICPTDLAEHDFTITVNGSVVPWHNNADRNQLRQWTLRYSRSRARESEEESNLTDRLAYWWDLAPWRGRDVELELVIRGARERNEIAWRSLTLRSAIASGNAGPPPTPDVPLHSLKPVRLDGNPLLGSDVKRAAQEPVRLLGQEFPSGLTLPKNSSAAVGLRPDYHKFVAIVGCSMQVAGPVQVLIDDRVVWERAAISSLSPAESIEIAIPAGAKTLTLQSGSDGLYYGTAAFVEAGFMK